MRKTFSIAVIAAVMTAVALLAQTTDKPPADKPQEHTVGGLRFVDATEVTVVNVDVRVTQKGRPVLGLGPKDFEVYQDGKLQELSNFAFYSRSSEPAGRPAAMAPAPVPTAAVAAPEPTPEAVSDLPPTRRDPRFVALYVDNENIMPFNRNRVLNKTYEWIRRELKAPDQAMVVSYQRSLKILQPFTSDPEEIVDALRTVRTYTGGRTEVNSSRREIENYIEQNVDQAGSYSRAIDRVKAFSREQRSSLTFTVGAIKELVSMMSGLPGKKAIVYVSDGLPMTPGLELFYEVQEKYRDPGSLSQSFEFDSTELFRGLVTAATASGVTFYTIDARGLEAELGIEAENQQPRSSLAAGIARTNYMDSLVYMADQTGGLAITNTNDVTEGLEKIADNLNTYYSLGYRLVPSGQDRMHRLQVKVKGRPDYDLSYRANFIEKSYTTTIGDRVMSGLAFDLEDDPLGISVSAGEAMPAASNRWALPVEVRVPFDKIAMIPEGKDFVGYVSVYYAARDEEGKQSDLQHVEHPVRIPAAEYERVKAQPFVATASLLLEPGIYRISVGVRDQLTNQAGYATLRKAVHPEAK